MSGKGSHIRFERSADTAAMDILTQLERLKIAAEQAGDSGLAQHVAVLFDEYLTRYCDGKHAALENALLHPARPAGERLN